MALTPQMIQAMNAATGNNVSTTGTPQVQSRGDQIRALAAKPSAPQTSPTPDNLGQATARETLGGAQKMQSSVAEGADKFAAVPDLKTGSHTPVMDAIGTEAKKTGALLETGLGTAAGAVRSIFAPLSAIVQKSTQAAGDATGIHPLDALASSPVGQKLDAWAKAHPDAAKNLMDAVTVAGGAMGDVGGEANPMNADIGKGVNDTLSTIKAIPSQVSDTVKAMHGIDAVGKDASALQDTIDAVSPKATPVAGAKDIAAGKGRAPTLFGKGAIDQSETPYIQKAAGDVRGLVSNKDSMIQNVNNVHDAIQNASENVVKPFLTENKVPFNFEDLQKSLDLVKPSSSLKSDATAFGTYDRVKNEIQQTLYETLSKNPERGNLTDMNDLWDARKVIDSKITQELGDATFGTPQYTGVKAAARDIRGAINKFIVDSIGNPGQMEQVNAMTDFLQTARSKGMDIPTEADAMKMLKQQFGLTSTDANAAKAAFFKDSLSKMNGMYDAISNMAPKAYGEIGKTGINLLLKQHPVLKKLIGAGLSGVGLGLGFKGIESL